MFLIKIVFNILFFAFLFGCTKETVTERTLIPERAANQQMNASIKVLSAQQITISKASLGKAFILMPTLRTSGQHPDLNFLNPLVISFERAKDRIGLFNLTEEQLFTTIPSSRLLQTFSVASEDETSIVINLDRGFTSFDSSQSLNILTKESLEALKLSMESGSKSSLDVKDSFVRSAETKNNSVYIEQVIRVRTTSLKEKLAPELGAKKTKTDLDTVEGTVTLNLEIKPYILNSDFQSKTSDKEQRVGYFINFAIKNQIDEPIPQITRWDIDEKKGPISVRLHSDTPQVVRQSMEEGILYWNRVMGLDILKIGDTFDSDERQTDRTIFVYWLPWDQAGFARAGFQADPVTGEIFRGQVMMTSSWYVQTQNSLKLIVRSKENATPVGLALCSMNQLDLLTSAFADLPTGDAAIERISQDTIRIVIAHEMGHALGLRHNFAGSSTAAMTDADHLQTKTN